MVFQPVTGAEDWYPDKKAVQLEIFNSLRTSAKAFGFNEVETPVFETLGLLTAKSGEEVKSQIFIFEKKGTEEMGLRFDLTVPFTRMFVAKQKAIAKPVKWFGIDKNWRYERPQKGRSREFYQLSVELFGSNKPEADAEVISLAIDCLKRFGLDEKDFYVRLNNRKLLEGLLIQAGVGKSKIEGVVRTIDKRLKISEEEFAKELLDQGLTQEILDQVKQYAEIQGTPKDVFGRLKRMKLSDESLVGMTELEAVCALLDERFVQINLSQARGLAYYTGTIFEVSDIKGEFRSIAGGGRYDNLVEVFGGEPTPAVGFAIGDKTFWLLLEAKGKLPQPKQGPDYFVVAVSEDVVPEARKILAKLRTTNSADADLMGRKFMKQFEYANTIGCRKVIIVGKQELAQGKVKVKDMETGEESLVDINNVR